MPQVTQNTAGSGSEQKFMFFINGDCHSAYRENLGLSGCPMEIEGWVSQSMWVIASSIRIQHNLDTIVAGYEYTSLILNLHQGFVSWLET